METVVFGRSTWIYRRTRSVPFLLSKRADGIAHVEMLQRTGGPFLGNNNCSRIGYTTKKHINVIYPFQLNYCLIYVQCFIY